jgi:hypothetical protein
MIQIRVQHIEDRVRSIFDEIGANLSEIEVDDWEEDDVDIDTHNMSLIIRSKIAESVDIVHKVAVYERVVDSPRLGEEDQESVAISDYVGLLYLEPKYLRIVSGKLDSWDYGVFVVEDESSINYHKQKDKWARGTHNRPKLFYNRKARRLEFYSSKDRTGHEEYEAYGIPYCEIEMNEEGEEYVSVCERCQDAIYYQIASMTMVAYGEIEKANQLQSLIEQHCG